MTDKPPNESRFYRDMWLAQRAENEQYRARLGEMPVSDEASEEIVALRAENERLKACLHDYENTYPEAKDTLRALVDYWKAIAQAHNDSLVARIAEVERLKGSEEAAWANSVSLRAENERLQRLLDTATDNSCYRNTIDRLQAENERLREALQHLANRKGYAGNIARAALRVEESALSAEFGEQSKSRELTADEQKGMEEALRGSGTYNERWKSKP
jgi:regulator of replication initiation timing